MCFDPTAPDDDDDDDSLSSVTKMSMVLPQVGNLNVVFLISWSDYINSLCSGIAYEPVTFAGCERSHRDSSRLKERETFPNFQLCFTAFQGQIYWLTIKHCLSLAYSPYAHECCSSLIPQVEFRKPRRCHNLWIIFIPFVKSPYYCYYMWSHVGFFLLRFTTSSSFIRLPRWEHRLSYVFVCLCVCL